MPRHFSPSERAALYLAADGHCARCGAELKSGWHADHVAPYARGGATDVINGQALCPTCNLTKGVRVPPSLRSWQARALREYSQSTQENFLVEATPGAGKTTFALTVARRLLDEGAISRVIVVCPTAHLRSQWATAALALDIQLDSQFANENGALSPDYHGAAITYASLVPGALVVRRLCSARALVILDEVHHCGEEGRSAWGAGLRRAFDGLACRRLLLSGTPFRQTGDEIPFVRYENGVAVPDYRYDYPAALTDGVCRPVEFLAYDGEMQWREVSGTTVTSFLSAANDEKDERRAFRSALLPDGAWMPDVLAAADRHLSQVREEIPDAGGLVLARDKVSARAYAVLLRRITGQEPTVVVSRDNGEDDPDQPDPSTEIRAFSKDPSKRWIVAVKLVSEGVDIPRLAVGVYATNTWTEMFFRQAIGRFVRLRSEGESAAVFVPSVATLLKLAARIADETDVTLRDQSERKTDTGDDGEDSGQLPMTEPLTSGAATEHSRIVNGETVTPDEIAAAMPIKSARPEYRSISDSLFALVVRDARVAAGIMATAVEPTTVSSPPPVAVEQKLRSLRYRVNLGVKRRARRLDEAHGTIHGTLNRLCGDRVPTASIKTLEKRLEILREWGEGL